MIRYDPTIVDLTSNFFVLCTNVKVYLYIFCLFGLILYIPVNNFSVMSGGGEGLPGWVEPVLSRG